MTAFGALFMLGEGGNTPQMVRVAPLGTSAEAPTAMSGNGLQPRNANVDRERWTSIVIHHSAHPLDDHQSIDRRHREQFNHAQLGYHFVIGNGSKQLGDGQAFVSARWDGQLDGAHLISGVTAPNSGQAVTNTNSIAICLVGNGDNRGFSPSQITRLVAVVSRLQKDFGISDNQVWAASDLPGMSNSGPGRLFPFAEFEQRLAIED